LTPARLGATNLNYSLSDNALVLSWPVDHLGWRLEAQTNSNATGLGTNWSTVPGSTMTNLLHLPLDVSSGSVWYRLAFP
jgi:hypothetical protein